MVNLIVYSVVIYLVASLVTVFRLAASDSRLSVLDTLILFTAPVILICYLLTRHG